MTSNSLAVAVLISGGGTTLKNLIDRRDSGELPIDIRLVISSRADVRGLHYAKEAGIATLVVPKKATLSPEAYSQAIFDHCRGAGVALVVMGGFLPHVLIPNDFQNRVINIHPSLIPAFSGKGFYGLHVHEAVLNFGAKITGCTVHYVDNQYDHGPIILQSACDVLDTDTPESLQIRVMELERQALPAAIKMLMETGTPTCSPRPVTGEKGE